MSKYCDEKISDEVLRLLKEANSPEEAEKVIKNGIDGWLVYSLENYSRDYNYLTKNWHSICKKLNVAPKKIVLVDDIEFDDNHKKISVISEYITRCGYVVRRVCEFLPCKVCEKAIPVEELWMRLKDMKVNVPEKWSDKCSTC